MNSWIIALPYFPEKELACRHCGLIRLDVAFAARLVALRVAWAKPLTPSSVCRCGTHNENEGGHKRSLHLTLNPVHQTGGTCAIDIQWGNWIGHDRFEFARLAWKLQWSLGLSKTFIHLDARAFVPDTPLKQQIFHYPSWDREFSDVQIKTNIMAR